MLACRCRRILPLLTTMALAMMLPVSPAGAWEMAGEKSILMHPRAGPAVALGTVTFVAKGSRYAFTLRLDHDRLKDYFLSMREFKCLESAAEIQCHVPYPHPHPGTVGTDDLAWLEHSLLFLYKSPQDFGARLWNGLYYRMQLTDKGIVGTPQAVDLDFIGAPPADPSLPPFGPGERYEIDPKTRWFHRLTIE